jgi:hypothetical protein
MLQIGGQFLRQTFSRFLQRHDPKSARRESLANLRPYFRKPSSRTLSQVISDPKLAPIAVVAGNGPSILRTPLHRLADFPLFVCNRANRIEALMEIGPRYWVWGDLLEDSLRFGLLGAFRVAPPETTFVLTGPDATDRLPESARNREILWAGQRRQLLDDLQNPLPPERLDAIESLTDCYKIRHSPMLAIQAALFLGYQTVVTIGIDHDFLLKQLRTEERTAVEHAYLEDAADVELLDSMSYLHFSQEVRLTWGTYAGLNNLARKLGRTILDATPGGQVDVFERLTFD